MIYLICTLSLGVNVLLFWYIRKLMQKYWFDIEAREKFTEMLEQYAEALRSVYRLEEFYGEEIIKTTIHQTQFVIDACKEFKESIDTEITKKTEDEDEENEQPTGDTTVVKLKEGEKVSQKASEYRKVIFDRE